MRGNGERIGPQNLPTSSVAGGVWNLLNQQRAQQRGAWPSATPAVVTDPYFMYVPLLLNTTSTNAQQNNTFLDSSTNNFTITRNGTPTQGAFTPYQPSGYWSGYFPGNSSSYLSVADNAAFNFTTGSWTIEAWAYPTARSATYGSTIVSKRNPGAPYTWAWDVSINPSGYPALLSASITSSILAPLNTWTHIAAVSNGSTITLYVNGVVAAGPTAYTVPSTTGAVYIGNYPTDNPFFNGYISNVRIVKGVAVYTGAFTPPTTPLASTQSAGTNIAAITGTATSLLTNQSNRFVDNSSNTFTVTVNGTTSIQAFQPFAPAASYSAATYGGSGYFNGTTDYLSTASNAALGVSSSDFTIETWVYFTDVTGYQIVFDARTAQPSQSPLVTLQNTSRLLYLWNSATFVGFGPTTLTPNTWYHVAVVRSSGVHTGYVNGVSYSLSTTDAAGVSSAPVILGARTVGGANDYLKGYLSNFRFVKGTAVYTGAFTPPTLAPLQTSGAASAASYPSTTNVNTSFGAANTSLLTNFTNAGIYDAAWQNNVTTVGSAQVSTTQAKFPTTSIKLNGTTDYCVIPNSPAFNFGTGDVTLEGWVYLNATNIVQSLIGCTSTSVTAYILLINSNNFLELDITGQSIIASSNAISASSWTHFAYTRSGGTSRLFVNGNLCTTSNNTITNALNTNGNDIRIGQIPYTGFPYYLNGYVQDVRITKGVARYTSSFSAPTAAFPTR